MDNKRKAILTLVVGINGTGKTTWLNNQIVNKSKKCLIITPDSSEWKTVPTITPGEVRTFTGIGKLIYNDDTLEVIKNNFFGGSLILDDAMSYLNNQTPDTLRYLYIRRRQRGIDLYVVAHGLKQLPPQIFTFATFLVLFNSVENFQLRKKEIIEENFNKIIEAQTEIMKKVQSGNPYYFKILLLDQQIKGQYVANRKKSS